ncbi:patatin-like phospholipase family protein [Polynucleobacter sp. MWH-UH2A]|uniref:patatin-like phospholipase family protein n=1 Tax=Polynucleobacter sp. MWH-UH2A TaxID=1855617 RepID=UPI001BFD6527|nr:patatin-like phospholipase family protein [Polynucleobacter sp. MWH-UH2A]QWD64685.1 twin-arginine translocation signal domain-containing protein [Polynucleobacter sp. MWH-UH2A]
MPQSSRRHFLKSSAVGAAAVASTQALGNASTPTSKVVAEVQNLEAKKIQATTASWDDGLAHPIPYKNAPGKGRDRAIVLGGGSEYMSSFLVGYFHAMLSNGVNLRLADIVVGTSAGAILGSALLGSRLDLFSAEFNLLADYPKIMAKFIPTEKFTSSQQRVMKMGIDAKDGSPATIQAIGHAAMAAKSIPQDKFETNIKVFLGNMKAIPPKMYITAIDCYTAERLVIAPDSGVPVATAVAASASAPGVTGPTWVKDRVCMDGSIGPTETHCDIVAGSKRALVIALADTLEQEKAGLRLNHLPNTILQEVRDLEAGGTKVKLVVIGMLPGRKTLSVVDPKIMAPAIKYGYERGMQDLPEMKQLWV